MQSTEPRRLDGEFEGSTGTSRGWLGVIALLVWIGVGIYSQFRAVMVVPYTIALVGAAVGVTLLAALFGTGDNSEWNIPTTGRRSRVDQLLVVGCLAAVTLGTAGMISAAGGVPASQPRVTTSALLAGALMIGTLFLVVGRWFGPVVAGLGVVGLGVVETVAPGSAIETMVYDSRGIYGPLTQAAAGWIAPACLLAGLWRASRLNRLLPTVKTVDSKWLTGQRAGRGLWLVTPPSMGFGAFLIAWLSAEASYLLVIGVAAVPAVGLWSGLLVASRRMTGVSIAVGGETGSETTADWRAWLGPLLLGGGPVALIAVLLVWRRLPLGTVLVAGNLLLVGLCTVGPKLGVGSVDGNTHQLRTGFETILDGSVVGMGLFARVAVVLAVVGGLTSVVGGSTGLLSTVLWLSGGSTAFAVLIGILCCVALGLAVPVIGGYAVGALLIVPLIETLAPIPELGAHLLVWYAVSVGWLFAPVVEKRVRQLQPVQRLRQSRWVR